MSRARDTHGPYTLHNIEANNAGQSINPQQQDTNRRTREVNPDAD
jgi:hypothetical protein